MRNKKKLYTVTGVHHGSIVEAKSKTEAKNIFRTAYDGERVTHIKDASNLNIGNL